MSDRVKIIEMLIDRVNKVSNDTCEVDCEALLALATAALAIETLCKADRDDKESTQRAEFRRLNPKPKSAGPGPSL